ncbi:MAG: SpoIID/LytB domain-containing protein [Lachnospiraceae bacterium]|nr:SpoIID/LytB domain-containing protein [Lachnospiraceae bacterium]
MKKLIYVFIFWIAALFLLLLMIPISKEELPPEPSVIKYLDLIDLIEQRNGTIRVVLKTTDFEDVFHEKVELFYDNQDVVFDMNCQESLYHIEPVERGITVKSIQRTQGNPTYLGTLDIYKTEEGFVLVNEVSLEEYLCSVVPSEMPASYPAEALKAQAIGARTYAALFYSRPGYPEYDAHVDDSVMYQVYNNIATSPEAIGAVEATAGLILCDSEKQLIPTYYYSTGRTEFEREEPWYAWEYSVEALDISVLSERLKAVGTDVQPFSSVHTLEIVSRGEENVAAELLVGTDTGEYHVYSEYNIRTVLCNGQADAIKQDGTTYFCKTLIPSGFIELTCMEGEQGILGYHITGGGFGHGNGMSQNGAKHMAANGWTAQEILEFYYEGCRIDSMYQGG